MAENARGVNLVWMICLEGIPISPLGNRMVCGVCVGSDHDVAAVPASPGDGYDAVRGDSRWDDYDGSNDDDYYDDGRGDGGDGHDRWRLTSPHISRVLRTSSSPPSWLPLTTRNSTTMTAQGGNGR